MTTPSQSDPAPAAATPSPRAPLPYPSRLTVWENIDLMFRAFLVFQTGLLAAVTGPFRGKKGTKKYRTHIMHAMFRQIGSSFTLRQSQTTTTAEQYEIFAKSRGLTPQTVSWGEDGLGHWLGDRQAKKVLIWYHGGGFYAPATTAYFEFLSSVVDFVRETGHRNDFAIFVPSYTLAPHAQYPTQLRQGLEALQYILSTGGPGPDPDPDPDPDRKRRNPTDILIGGDSAGGNLALAILSHLAHPHPHPQIQSSSDLLHHDDNKQITPSSSFPSSDNPLLGLIIMGPWVSFSHSWPSMKSNKRKDLVSSVPITENWKYFLGGDDDGLRDNYNEPLRADAEWWGNVPVSKALFILGGDEIMLDGQREFGGKFAVR